MEKQVVFETRVDIMRIPSWLKTEPPDDELRNGQIPSSGELGWSQKSLPQFSSTGYSKCGLPKTRRGATNYNYGYSKAEPANMPGLLIFSNDDDYSEGYSRCGWVHSHPQWWTVVCWTCMAILSLITLAVLAIVLTWVIILPRRPDLNLMDQVSRVQSFSVSQDIHYTSSGGVTTREVLALLNANFTLQLLVKNPNRVATIYSSSSFSIAYKDTVVGNVVVPAFSQKAHATTQQSLEMVIAKVAVPQENAFSLLEDANVHDSISLQLDGHVHARLQILGLSTPSVMIKLWCSVDIKDPYFRTTRDIAPRIGFLKPALIESLLFPAVQGDSGKMSASDTTTASYVTDFPKEISTKVDIPVKILSFFLDDDVELERIKREYGAGRMLTGHVNQCLIQVLTAIVDRHQKARLAVTEEMVDTYMAGTQMPRQKNHGIRKSASSWQSSSTESPG